MGHFNGDGTLSPLISRRPENKEIASLAIERTAELQEKLCLKPSEILQLLKGAYGRVDAPYLSFMELKRGLEALDFVPSPFDPCTFVLPDPSTGATEGIRGIHVDDGKLFQQKLQQLSEKFPFGSQQKSIFTFTGLRIDQQPDQSIWINQTQYINNIHPISIPRDRRMKPDDPVKI